ncbi:divergent protein kinase domain 1C-like isoform X2 [Anneissia japonica]|uniref:divergent protein kinase domain 1C-like isoform X2 n=1 Tax=Anneissia japonica TaxID=1529436 RepID=UPI001425563B|nr:divergent protein kinase domain 1C-like isoform X2 [Anneissia japonica]
MLSKTTGKHRVSRWKSTLLKACLILVAICLAYAAFTGRLMQLSQSCTHKQSKVTIGKLCDLYKSKIINGNLCNDICSGNIEYIDCLHSPRGKVVLLAQWKNQKIVLKTKHPSVDAYAPVYSVMENLEGIAEKMYPEDVIFKSLVESQAQTYLGTIIKEGDDVVDRFWFGNWSKDRLNTLSFHASMNSLWMLMSQDEYIFLKYHDTHPNVPQVLGACGYFYAVEYSPPGVIFEPEFLNIGQQLQSAPWQGRANIALGLLKLITAFDKSFPQKLYHCDVKEGNFGLQSNTEWATDAVVKVIDVDMVFYENKIGEIMGQGECVRDSDCDFFHCRGRCNQETRMCSPEIISSNLQVFCSNLFLPRHGKPGLLRYPPSSISKELAIVLEKCTTVGQSPRQADIQKELKRLLIKSLE